MRGIGRFVSLLTELSGRFVPSAFVIAALLTSAVFAAAFLAAGRGPGEILGYWGDGFWALLGFGMQMCLIVVTGAMLAEAPPVERALDAFARLPKSGPQAVALAAAASMLLCWMHWGLGIMASAFLARRIALRRPATDFRLLVAVSYFGMGALWHAGLSGSAPLLVATPRHFLEPLIGVIPLSQTVFSPFNLGLAAATLAALTLLAWAMYPAEEDAFRLSPGALKALEEIREPERTGEMNAWMRMMEHSRVVSGALGLCGILYLLRAFSRSPELTLDRLNFIFLTAGLLLYPSPASFVRAAERASRYVHGIILQFPFYAGMYGVIKGAGLDMMLGRAFVRLAAADTFPFIVYWYSGVLNYFIPSGGSKWAIEAPYLLEAAKTLGVPPAKVVLAYSWGDMVTDMIQPFWCVPLLAVAKLEFKDILGYEAAAFLVCAVLGSVAFLFI